MAAASETGDRPRFRIGLRLGLTVCFGGLVFIAVALVLLLGIWSSLRNTRDLLADQATTGMRLLRNDIAAELDPVAEQVRFVAGFIDAERPADMLSPEGRLATLMTGALAATPSTFSLTLITPDAAMLNVERRFGGAEVTRSELGRGAGIRQLVRGARRDGQPYWGPVVWHPEAKTAVVNYRYPLGDGGAFAGILAGAMRLDRLSQVLQEAASAIAGRAFILYGGQHVLAHSDMVRRELELNATTPLPRPEDIDDPVLQAVAAGRLVDVDVHAEGIGGHVVRTGEGDEFLVLTETFTRFGETPWRLVLYFPLRDVSTEILRTLWAAAAGLVILVLSIVVALFAARRISVPLVRLTRFADRARRLELAEAGRLPRSRLRELDDAADAMNAMRVGLGWFETYVPKRLVGQLMAQGEAAIARSEDRNVTVMFTDIVGFTSLAEGWTAEETASFLNDHFALLAQAIEETGGTIDKFIGDAVMAFWGAPEPQTDHAARAVGAARAIAAALAADNAERRRAGREEVRLRIGLHTGAAVVGNIGAPGRMNYTIVGDTVNVANRLEQAGHDRGPTGPVTILASEATVRAAGCHTAATPIGEITLRGRREPMSVFLL